MPSHPPARRLRSLAAAALVALLGCAVTTPTAQAAPGPSDEPTQDVAYQGHTFTVPESWRVVDLAQSPEECVRFDRHAVYLGTPTDDQHCPTRLTGRTEALLVQPGPSPAEQQGTLVSPTSRQFDATADGIQVTAGYATDPGLITRILAGAGLPTAAPRAPRALGVATSVAADATNYTGKGFDACAAPSANAMNAWMTSSPYRAVGIYIGGADRACAQSNLTSSWVRQQSAAGWHFMPLYVGPQAAEIGSPGADGTGAADDAVNQAAGLGLGPGSTLYYDMEAYNPTYSGSVMGLLSAWTQELHAKGYHSAVYSSSSSGISDLVANAGSGYKMPDVLYDANWNHAADTLDPVIPGNAWADHQRVHQYNGNLTENWGGVQLNIDQDYLDVSLGSSPSPGGRSGDVWDRGRAADGTWQGSATKIDANTSITAETSAALPDGTVHLFTVVPGSGVWERVRDAAGNWQGSAAKIDGNGSITAVTAAGLPDGSIQLVAEVANSGLWQRSRGADGTWQPSAAKIDANSAITSVTSAALPDGTVHLFAVVPGSGVWERVRDAAGNWQGSAAKVDANGSITAVSVAALPDGTLHLFAVLPGSGVWQRDRSAAGAWQGGAAKVDANGSITAVTSAALPDGTLHLFTVLPNSGVWERVLATTGTWQSGATKTDANGGIFAAAATGLADGTLHLEVLV